MKEKALMSPEGIAMRRAIVRDIIDDLRAEHRKVETLSRFTPSPLTASRIRSANRAIESLTDELATWFPLRHGGAI